MTTYLPPADQNLDTAQNVYRLIERKHCVIWLGAGVSIDSDRNFQSWSKAVHDICLACNISDEHDEFSDDLDLRKKVMKARESDSIAFWNETLNQFCPVRTPSRSRNLEIIFKLPFEHIVTTNFDNLIDSCYPNHHTSEYPYLHFEEIHSLKKTIFYLHGRLDRDRESQHIVFGEDEYESAYKSEDEGIRPFLYQLLISKDVIFIGSRVNEREHLEILKKVAKRREQLREKQNFKARTICAILPEKDINSDRELRDRQRSVFEDLRIKYGVAVYTYTENDDYQGLNLIFEEINRLHRQAERASISAYGQEFAPDE